MRKHCQLFELFRFFFVENESVRKLTLRLCEVFKIFLTLRHLKRVVVEGNDCRRYTGLHLTQFTDQNEKKSIFFITTHYSAGQ